MDKIRIAEAQAVSKEFLRRRYLSERELAAMLGLSVKTLQGWRLRGQPPAWQKLHGAVRYPSADLEAWLADCPKHGEGDRAQ